MGEQVNRATGQAMIAVADALIDQFAAIPTVNPIFVFLRREDIARGIRERIHRPGLIDQGTAGLCGPASILYQTALMRPVDYVQFACGLFDRGSARLSGMQVTPNQDLRLASKPNGIEAVDWLTMASIRNSENSVLFTYKKTGDEFSGLTTPGEMADWLRRTGYTDIKNETSTFLFSKDQANAQEASDLFEKHYKVFLLINAQMLKFETEDETSKVPDHWVCLSSRINFSHSGVKFTIYTWGNPRFEVPQPPRGKPAHDFTLKMFLENYYGYVGARR
jgi:hypothetical protein